MVEMDRLMGLLNCHSDDAWSEALFALALDYGFEQTLFGVVPDKQTPLEDAFLRSNYSPQWRKTYDAEKFQYIDPTINHCLVSSIPLIWQPQTFSSVKEKLFYEKASDHGICNGITYPIHGANGEFGVVSFVSDTLSHKKFREGLNHCMPDLALIRDYLFESSLKFLKPVNHTDDELHLTNRELECLKWAMAGKSSWEISRIMRCSESTVNFHIANLRRKFKVNTRQQVIIKAIRAGLITPD